MQQQTIANISKLLQTQSMYDLALDIGISQYSLYCYVNDFAKVSQRMKDKIQTYINKKVDKIS
jgi:hypothetical protein